MSTRPAGSSQFIDAFTPSDEETKLIQQSFLNVGPESWALFAAGIHEQLIGAYRDGYVTLEQALQHVLWCSIGCEAKTRIILVAWTAHRALESQPSRKRKRQPNPPWVRNSAANLLEMFRENRPDEQFAPNDLNGWTTPILEDALRQLTTLRICKPVSARTLYQWWLKAPKPPTQSNSTSTA
jgi:hypothetical protein